jgi:hypothetical protein
MRIYLLFLFSSFLAIKFENLFSQSTSDYYTSNFMRYVNYTYTNNVKTVMLFSNNDPLYNPTIKLNSEDELTLVFDDLANELRSYKYTFIHCNSSWEASPINENEYIEGFTTNFINDYAYSINTKQPYIHYELRFPNENVNFTKSGNYLLKIFNDEHPEFPIITRRFLVYENLVQTKSNLKSASNIDFLKTGQQIDFSFEYGNLKVINPFENFSVGILQNYRWDNAKLKLKPTFLQESRLLFNNSDETIFKAGNEFRNLDIKNLHFRSERIQKIENDTAFQIHLYQDKTLAKERYSSMEDINGKFIIKNQLGKTSETDADYALVHFSIASNTELSEGNVYIFGALSDWNYNNNFKMHYNPTTKSYEKSLYLKQGYYNYSYQFVRDNSNHGDESLFEGSFFETENDYTILIYYQETGKNYQQLVGVSSINSAKK